MSILGPELVALADLASIYARGAPPWAVSETSLTEFERVGGERGRRLRQWWWEWADHWHSLEDAFPEVDSAELAWPGRDVHPDQIPMFELPELPNGLPRHHVPPIDEITDLGDRALIRDAARAGISTILTTDVKSFWRHRQRLCGYGLEVWKPTDVLATYKTSPLQIAA